jgi:hypothetical protein
MGMKQVLLKFFQEILQKTITWTKKSSKRHQKWEKAYVEAGLPSQKLKMPMKTFIVSKVVLFQETFEYVDAIINICYHQQSLQLQVHVPSGLTWAIACAITKTLNSMV